MKKLFFLSIMALALVATGCSKDENGNPKLPDGTTYDVPTESKTEVSGASVVRTQVISAGKEAVKVTYSFDGTTYSGQQWDFIFSTEAGALVGYAAFGAKYMQQPEVKVTVDKNIATIKYPLGAGIGDEKLQGLTSLDAIKNAVEILDILGLFNGNN